MTVNEGAKSPAGQAAYQAVEEVLRRAFLHKTTGTGYIQIDFVQGGVANVKCELKEVIKPQRTS